MADNNVSVFSQAEADTNVVVLAESNAAFANSAAAGTVVNLDIPLPVSPDPETRYLVVVHNPSTETALTVQAQVKETLGGAAVFALLESIAVPVNSAKAVVVQGFLLGEAGRLAVSNDTAVGLAGAFTAKVKVRKA